MRLRQQIAATGDPILIELLAELAIESFFPADPQTTETLNRIAREVAGQQGSRRP